MWCADSQDRDDGLAIFPSHLLGELDSRNQITGAARAHKKAVLLNEESSHADSLSIRYPGTQRSKKERDSSASIIP